MNHLILSLYNLGVVAMAATGLLIERRGRPRFGVGLMFAALLLQGGQVLASPKYYSRVHCYLLQVMASRPPLCSA